jgi:putative zinc finger protein
MFETCTEIRKLLSEYLDGAIDRERFSSVRFHLTYCASCRRRVEEYQEVEAGLQSLTRRRVPPDLALRLRVQLSRRLHQNLLSRFRVFLDNALKPLLLPVSGGVLGAVAFFALLMSVPGASLVSAPQPDMEAATPPRILALAPLNFPTGDEELVLVTHVNSIGKVLDYSVLSGQSSPALLHRLDRMLYFSQFAPATVDGKPTEGQVVISLRWITVRG